MNAIIRYLKKAALALFTVAGLALFPSCDGGGGILPPDRTWVATEPIQCLGNPWEEDWLERHGNNYSAYPQDKGSQNAIVREYYARLGVEVTDIISVPKYQAVCLACVCARGDVLYLLVRDEDVGTMLVLGFRRESPYWPHPGDTALLGDYRYTGYDSSGSPLIQGTLTFLRMDSTSVSGVWRLQGPGGYGPQIGMGMFEGGVDGRVVWLNLNPDYVDNNVVLYGELNGERYAGRWQVITFAGVGYTGTFEAVKCPGARPPGVINIQP